VSLQTTLSELRHEALAAMDLRVDEWELRACDGSSPAGTAGYLADARRAAVALREAWAIAVECSGPVPCRTQRIRAEGALRDAQRIEFLWLATSPAWRALRAMEATS
jgi:hypothetical protein